MVQDMLSIDDTHNHTVREAGIERNRILDALHLFRGQRNVQRLDVLLKLFDFPATDNGEHVGNLMQMVCNSNCKQMPLDTETFRNGRERKTMTYLPRYSRN